MRTMKYNIVVIPGDGIGPEIIVEAKKVLNRIGEKFGHSFHYTEVLMGGASIDATGVPLTEEALKTAKNSDSVLLGAVGGKVGQSNWYSLPPHLRPEAGLLGIRKGLGLFANIRPALLFDELKGACPLKDEIIGDGFDFIVVRELTGGLYFGERKTYEENGLRKAFDTLIYDENEIRRIAKWAFEIARKREEKGLQRG
jgi:3-isopropylmalate dehydrogenase